MPLPGHDIAVARIKIFSRLTYELLHRLTRRDIQLLTAACIRENHLEEKS